MIGFRVLTVKDTQSMAASQFLTLTVEHIDNLLADWYYGLDSFSDPRGTKGVWRIAPCRKCLEVAIKSDVEINESRDVGSSVQGRSAAVASEAPKVEENDKIEHEHLQNSSFATSTVSFDDEVFDSENNGAGDADGPPGLNSAVSTTTEATVNHTNGVTFTTASRTTSSTTSVNRSVTDSVTGNSTASGDGEQSTDMIDACDSAATPPGTTGSTSGYSSEGSPWHKQTTENGEEEANVSDDTDEDFVTPEIKELAKKCIVAFEFEDAIKRLDAGKMLKCPTHDEVYYMDTFPDAVRILHILWEPRRE